jgi:hypothetical protein
MKSNFLTFDPTSPTIGSLSVELLRRGLEPKDVLAKVKQVFPAAKTTMACIYWYASQAQINLQRKSKADMTALKAVLGSK